MPRVNRRSRLGVALVAVVPAVLTIALLMAGVATRAQRDRALGDQVEAVPVGSWQHVASAVSYPSTPPAGGDHRAGDAACGFFDAPLADDRAVASLAAGAVWIAYQPQLSDDELARLRLFGAAPEVLVSPVADLPAPVVATAWGRRLHLSTPEDGQLDRFVRRYRANAYAPEAAQPCTDPTSR